MTDLKFAIPDITFNAQSIVSTAAYDSDFPVTNIVNGPLAAHAKLQAAIAGQHTIEWDLGAGNEKSAEYFALLKAKPLKNSGVEQVCLRGSDASYVNWMGLSWTAIWDPSRDYTIDSVNRISQINDLTGNGNHATQSTDASKPLLSRADNKENRAIYSEDLSNAAWTKYELTVNSNAIANPLDGAVTADELIEAVDVGDWHQIDQTQSVISGVTYRMSGYFRQASGTRHIAAWFRNGFLSASQIAYFDLTNGVVDAHDVGVTASIESVGSGWYRVIAECVATSTTSTGHLYFQFVKTLGSVVYNGDGSSSLYAYGLQYQEQGADADYLATSGFIQYRGINGNRVAVFDGSDDHLFANGVVSSYAGEDKPFTLFFVLKHRNPSASNVGAFSFAKNGGNAFHRLDMLSTTCETYRRDDAATTVSATGGSSTNAVTVWSYIYTGTTTTLKKDGVVVINAASMNNSTATFDRFAIGVGYFAGSIVSYLRGDYGLIALLPGAIDSTNEANIENYLINRFQTTPIVSLDDLDELPLTGPTAEHYIEYFTETTAYRYWALQIDAPETSTRTLGKVLFGKLFDINRDPADDPGAEHVKFQDKGMRCTRRFNLPYRGITPAKQQEFEAKIGQFKDENLAVLVGEDSPITMTQSLIPCAITDYNFTQKNPYFFNGKIELEELT